MLLRSLVFLCLVAFSLSCTPPNIVRPASRIEHGYHVSVLFNGEHHCSGSIIDEYHILTSLRCIRMYGKGKIITIRAGSNSINTGGVKYSIQSIIEPDDSKADIALLRTRNNIKFSEGVETIEFIDHEVFTDDDPLTILAWKHEPLTGVPDNDDHLREYRQKIYNIAKCKLEYKWESAKPMCTYDPTKQGLCHTDAGGPIIANGYLIGIHSNSRDCMDKGDPTVHTPVYPHKSWIEKALNWRNVKPPVKIPEVTPRPNKHYYHVDIRLKNNKHICSGSIINKRHILTSKICVMSYMSPQLLVSTGVTSLLEKGKSYSVEKITQHDNHDCDIAILRTTSDIAFDKNVNSIPITEEYDDLYYGEIVTLTGYERPILDRETNKSLQEISHRVIDNDSCVKKIPFLNKVYACTTVASDAKLACNMDDGSPIVANGILVAMNPADVFCSGDTHVILPLIAYSSWIEKTARL